MFWKSRAFWIGAAVGIGGWLVTHLLSYICALMQVSLCWIGLGPLITVLTFPTQLIFGFLFMYLLAFGLHDIPWILAAILPLLSAGIQMGLIFWFVHALKHRRDVKRVPIRSQHSTHQSLPRLGIYGLVGGMVSLALGFAFFIVVGKAMQSMPIGESENIALAFFAPMFFASLDLSMRGSPPSSQEILFAQIYAYGLTAFIYFLPGFLAGEIFRIVKQKRAFFLALVLLMLIFVAGTRRTLSGVTRYYWMQFTQEHVDEAPVSPEEKSDIPTYADFTREACDRLSNETKITNCYMQNYWGESFNIDALVCTRLAGSSERVGSDCASRLGERSADKAACLQLELPHLQAACMTEYRRLHGIDDLYAQDSSHFTREGCDGLTDEKKITECYELNFMGEWFTIDASVCARIADISLLSARICASNLGERFHDVALCRQMKLPLLQAACMTEIALYRKDLSLCDTIPSDLMDETTPVIERVKDACIERVTEARGQ